MIQLIKENRKALRFLLVFVVTYLSLNTAYGLYINSYYPTSDPFTQWVSGQVVWLLRFFDPDIRDFISSDGEYIAIANGRENLIFVYEGCNGLNVFIVYLSFLLAFTGSLRQTIQFIFAGLIGIHVLNLGRITALYGVAFYFPDQLYFFHKYLFTGIIYVIVFVLWYLWVKRVTAKNDSQVVAK